MNFSESELKELHKVELNILKEFIKVCKKLNLQYYLLGGSALGAIRHDGFIPWDDDIDVGMPRKDYEKFLNEAQSYLPSNYFIQTMNSDKNYRNHFAKIRNNDTCFIEESIKNIDMNHGIYIDIFPLDGCGNTIEEAKNNFYKYSKLNEIYLFKNHKISHSGLRNKFRCIYYWVLSLRYKNIFKVEEEIQNYCSSISYEKSKYVCNYFGMWREKEISLKKWFGKGKETKFENIKVIIPNDSDKYLNKLYGEYMQLPPVEKRVAPHCYILDTNKSYKNYID